MIEIDDASVKTMSQQIFGHGVVTHALLVTVMHSGIKQLLNTDEALEAEVVVILERFLQRIGGQLANLGVIGRQVNVGNGSGVRGVALAQGVAHAEMSLCG